MYMFSIYLTSECIPGQFGIDCSLTCDSCMNDGVCNEDRTGCVCTAGWRGIICNETCSAVSLDLKKT